MPLKMVGISTKLKTPKQREKHTMNWSKNFKKHADLAVKHTEMQLNNNESTEDGDLLLEEMVSYWEMLDSSEQKKASQLIGDLDWTVRGTPPEFDDDEDEILEHLAISILQKDSINISRLACDYNQMKSLNNYSHIINKIRYIENLADYWHDNEIYSVAAHLYKYCIDDHMHLLDNPVHYTNLMIKRSLSLIQSSSPKDAFDFILFYIDISLGLLDKIDEHDDDDDDDDESTFKTIKKSKIILQKNINSLVFFALTNETIAKPSEIDYIKNKLEVQATKKSNQNINFSINDCKIFSSLLKLDSEITNRENSLEEIYNLTTEAEKSLKYSFSYHNFLRQLLKRDLIVEKIKSKNWVSLYNFLNLFDPTKKSENYTYIELMLLSCALNQKIHLSDQQQQHAAMILTKLKSEDPHLQYISKIEPHHLITVDVDIANTSIIEQLRTEIKKHMNYKSHYIFSDHFDF